MSVVHLLDGVIKLLFELFSLDDAVSLLLITLVHQFFLQYHAVNFLFLNRLSDRKSNLLFSDFKEGFLILDCELRLFFLHLRSLYVLLDLN